MVVADFATGKKPEQEGGSWYNQAEAKAILDNLSAKDVHIEAYGNRLVFALRDDLEKRLEALRYKAVDKQVGYSLDKPGITLSEQERWYDEEEEQVSVSDRILQLKKKEWGDPNDLLSYGPEGANRLWKKDPMVIRQLAKRQQDIARVQRELERSGRL